MERERLDYLVARQAGVSRSMALSLVEGGAVKVDGKTKTKPSQKFDLNSKLDIDMPKHKPSPLKLEVIYEDDDCVVINKPAGVLVHSKGAFNIESTVASWLLPKVKGFDKNNNRAGIVHRLDRGTSGVMLCAKNPEALSFFQKQFSSRKVIKKYVAVIEGNLEPAEAVIDIPIERNPKDPKRFKVSMNGKYAKTAYKIQKIFTYAGHEYSLLSLTPKTGRTHQLRVHLKHMKHPIIGDDFYDGKKADRLYLHALSLEITLPGGKREVFTADLPSVFNKPKISSDG
ncbi:MAG TPA: RluA family pseudouridine synthase [Candidatus Saccharimonadales bacterium]|nr:RluA family pseudouridine synthase [Candidatus Saccharimonadales bacterium]